MDGLDWMDGWARLAPWEIGMEKQRAMKARVGYCWMAARAPPATSHFLVILAGLGDVVWL
jgi:hypothetical protein